MWEIKPLRALARPNRKLWAPISENFIAEILICLELLQRLSDEESFEYVLLWLL